MPSIQIIRANLQLKTHQDAVLAMTDAYSSDSKGDAKPLSDSTRKDLIRGLQEHPTTLIFLAMDQEQPCGIATCFRGFSTFAAKSLINIHDLFVLPSNRGQGIARLLLDAIENEAKASHCCKLTLEVLQSNTPARAIYDRFGFGGAVYGGNLAGEPCYFLSKKVM